MIYSDQLDDKALSQYAAWLNARAGQIGAMGRLTAESLRDRILDSGGRCEWCGADVVGAEFELDHIVSLRRGGVNAPGNLALACPDCNRRKARKHAAQFAAEIHSMTGRRTPLVDRLLRAYAVDGGHQLSLFPAERQESRLDAAYNWSETSPPGRSIT